jgi:hypothetical protein
MRTEFERTYGNCKEKGGCLIRSGIQPHPKTRVRHNSNERRPWHILCRQGPRAFFVATLADHSERSAVSGSTRVARHAGI